MSKQVTLMTDAIPYQEFAKLIGKSTGAVRRMIDKGKLPVPHIRYDLAQHNITPKRWELEALARGATVIYDGKTFTYQVVNEWENEF
nr:Cox family DNA-binding protein [Escherichia coli]